MKKFAYVWLLAFPLWVLGWAIFGLAWCLGKLAWVAWNLSYSLREKVGVMSRPPKLRRMADGDPLPEPPPPPPVVPIEGNGVGFP